MVCGIIWDEEPACMERETPTVKASMLVAMAPKMTFFKPLRFLHSDEPLIASWSMDPPTYKSRMKAIHFEKLFT